MVRDNERTYLEVPQARRSGPAHARGRAYRVQAQDRNGAFSSPWFPFLLGTMVGNTLGNVGAPAVPYPPTGTFGRGEQLHGSLDSTRPEVPDYSKVQPSPNATAGQSSGTGGGVAATNKAPNSEQRGDRQGRLREGHQSFESRQPTAPKLGKPSTGLSGGKGLAAPALPHAWRR